VWQGCPSQRPACTLLTLTLTLTPTLTLTLTIYPNVADAWQEWPPYVPRAANPTALYRKVITA